MTILDARIWRYGLASLPATLALVSVLIFGKPNVAEGVLLVLCVLILTSLALLAAIKMDYGKERASINLLESIRSGEYSARARLNDRAAPISVVLSQINALAEKLQEKQSAELEAISLLRKALAALGDGVFLFDHENKLKLVNPAGALLLGAPAQRLIGQSVDTLRLTDLMAYPSGSIQFHEIGGSSGRWQITRATLRSGGQPANLLVVKLVEPLLQKEQAEAFSRLLRVISHEINNSLAPIASMASTAAFLLPKPGQPMCADSYTDMVESLDVIGRRSKSLQNFIGQYARLARLPPPRVDAVRIVQTVSKLVALFGRDSIQIDGDEECVLADQGQLEQVLINLVRNGLQSPGSTHVVVRWRNVSDKVRMEIIDDGAGLSATDNLFVPFYSTKKNGMGIGLALSRQILNAHGCDLKLASRTPERGAVACFELMRARADAR